MRIVQLKMLEGNRKVVYADGLLLIEVQPDQEFRGLRKDKPDEARLLEFHGQFLT